MTNHSTGTTDLDYADKLWRAANALRGQVDAEYKHVRLARELRDPQRHGEELGLSSEETAFYDALAENGLAREAIQNDTLRLMARNWQK